MLASLLRHAPNAFLLALKIQYETFVRTKYDSRTVQAAHLALFSLSLINHNKALAITAVLLETKKDAQI